MTATTYRVAGVRVSRDLEKEAREKSGLGHIPLGALVRIGLATLAGYDREQAITLFFLDPSSKRYSDFCNALGSPEQQSPEKIKVNSEQET